jgi:hypothetical protein
VYSFEGEAQVIVAEGRAKVACEGPGGKHASERPSADFVGASEDGSEVFFTTFGQLTKIDTDVGNDLYLATIGCPQSRPACSAAEREVTSLTQVSHDPNGGAAEVQGVVRTSPDGSRTYFVARGVLTNEPGPEGRVPLEGADNLYVYTVGSGTSENSSTSGSIKFIGDLCSGHSSSGTVEDSHCPNASGVDTELWLLSNGRSEAQTAGLDGRFLVFSSYGQLLPEDTDAAKDVYRYDAETGVLERVSIGEGGYDANGSGGSRGAQIPVGNHGVGTEEGSVRTQYEMGSRAISEDGSRIAFTSGEPLSPSDTNGLVNAYEWHEGSAGAEGSVSLVSSGVAEEPVSDVVISSNGLSVFFDTTEGLVSQDTDGEPDVYDARVGGGFPVTPTPVQPCSGDACQGPLTNPAPLLMPGSVSQAPGGNIPSVKKAVPKKATPKCKRGYGREKGKCVKQKPKRAKKTNHRKGSH